MLITVMVCRLQLHVINYDNFLSFSEELKRPTHIYTLYQNMQCHVYHFLFVQQG